MSIFGLRVGSGITVASGITISSQFPPTQGQLFTYTKNTYFNTGPNFQQSGITTTSTLPGFGGPGTIWQLAYAWQQTNMNQLGVNCYLNIGTNPPLYAISIATAANSLSTMNSFSTIGYDFGLTNFAAGQFSTPGSNFARGYTIPAGT